MKEKRAKKINTAIVIFLGLFLIIFIGLRILYPKNYFDSEKKNRSVTAVQFLDKENAYLVVNPELGYNFYSATVEISPKSIFSKEKNVEVEKGFLAQLYPLGEEIETANDLKKYIFSDNSDIPNGKLVSTNDAVYLYSRGKWSPFLSPLFFEGLGFDWDRVEPLKESFDNSFEEGEKIIAGTPHSDGTIFETKDGNFFIVWEKKLLPIKNEEIIKEAWSDYFVIQMDELKPKKIGECNQTGSLGIFRCSFAQEYTKGNFTGDTFIFPFGADVSKIKKVSVVLDTFNITDLKNLKITVSFQKTRMIGKYKDEIFK